MSVRRRKFAAARRRAETAALELRLVKWIGGIGVAGAGLVVAALRLLG